MRAKLLVALLFCLGLSFSFSVFSQSQKRKFVVVHSMHYKDDVDVSKFGVLRNPIVYESSLLPSKSSDEFVQGGDFQKLAESLEKGPLPTVIDIERWSIYLNDEFERRKNREKFLEVLKKVRAARPDILFGYYGVIPERIYWPLVDASKTEEKFKWDTLNIKALADFSPYVDAIYPSLYTFYEDRAGWKRYAEETLKAARKFGKPVYCYLWPQYHSSNLRLEGRYLPVEYWRMELEVCRQYGDGVVIWNYEPKKNWDPDAAWWQQTLRFLEDNSLN